MVSAGTAYKLAFDVDRSPIPWSDIAAADVIFAIGANIGECAPITTDYIWRARDHGAKLIVADPRMTPISRNADLYLPLRPGTDLVLLMSMLHVILREGLEDKTFIAEHTTRLRRGRRIGQAVRSAHGGRTDRRSAGSHREGGAIVRRRRARRRDARARHRASIEGRRKRPGADQHRAGHRQYRARRLRRRR